MRIECTGPCTVAVWILVQLRCVRVCVHVHSRLQERARKYYTHTHNCTCVCGERCRFVSETLLLVVNLESSPAQARAETYFPVYSFYRNFVCTLIAESM